MRPLFIFISICLSNSFGVYSQTSVAVPQVSIWYDGEQNRTNQGDNSQLIGESAAHGDSAISLNFHSVKTFNETVTPIRSSYDIGLSSRLTVIVVFHSRDTVAEHGIWSVFKGGKQITGLTDKRLIRKNSEYVYPVKRRGIPLINTSIQAFSKIRGDSDSNYFVLGEAFLPDSTRSFYSGDIAECLVFDRFLKKQEALKIETYLAIKYGITLIESDYISPSDVVLWDYEENQDYSNGIAGLGRDSVFGLAQKQGSSSEEEDLLTIGLGAFTPLNRDNSSLLTDGNYLIWGHNDKELVYDVVDCKVSYPLMARKWLVQSTNTKGKSFSTWVKFLLPEDYRDSTRLCYLLIDRSGSGDFSSSTVDYIVQSQVDTNGYVYFEDVVWDANGKNVFGFSYGFDLEVEIMPSCPDISTGSLTVSICGGESPFDYLLESDSTRQQFIYQGDRDCTFEELAAGDYTLTVSDIYNNKVSQNIVIVSDSIACLDTLGLANNNRKSLENNDKSDKNLDNLSSHYYNVYPNPTSGYYKITADLPTETPIVVRIYTVNGSLLDEKKDYGKKQYFFDNYMSTQGNYIIEIETVFEKKSFKLAIIN